jgi:exodeoxyribonuclease VII large subunit
MQIEVRALPTLFEPRGDFQLTVETIRRSGIGALYEAFERLKLRLAAEGLFAPGRKRALPAFPGRVGIVTSPQAAALRDVLTILRRRMPALPVIVYPTLVQGAEAAQAVARTIDLASRRLECDVLIVCRGGGSIEDLWAFNDEAVARAIHRCALPVVTGIGHETDFTIADFVADVRAPTPSAAAQAVSPDARALCMQLAETRARLARALGRRLDTLWQGLDYLGRRLIDPHERLRGESRHLAQLGARLAQAGARSMSAQEWALNDLRRRLAAAGPDLQRCWNTVQHLRMHLRTGANETMQVRQARLDALGARLQAMNPHAVLDRGYAIATDAHGRIVTDAAALAPGDTLNVRLAHGGAESRVTATHADDAGQGDAAAR